MIETLLGRAMWAAGLRYRKQYGRVPGRPDFVIVRCKIAVFCDSSFWHGRNWTRAAKAIKSNREFWIPKIERNIARDKAVNRALRQRGWRVLRFWDDEIIAKAAQCAGRILDAANEAKKDQRRDRDSGDRLLLRRRRHDQRFDKGGVARLGGRGQRASVRENVPPK